MRLSVLLLVGAICASCSTGPPFTQTYVDGAPRGQPLSLTGTVRTLAGLAGVTGTTDATGAAARFNAPAEIALSSDLRSLYLSDFENHVIRKIDVDTGAVTTVVGSAGTTGTADGIGTAARLNRPVGLTADETHLYVAEFGNHTIRRIKLSNFEVTTIAGGAGVTGDADGTGTAARFNTPEGVALDGSTLYVAEFSGNKIRAIDLGTMAVTTVAGSSTAGAVDAVGTAARFNQPTRCISVGGALYVADYGNHAIRKIDLATKTVTTFAGSMGSQGVIDGQGTSARFAFVAGLVTDGFKLYTVSYTSNVIRTVDLSTATVTTLAGIANSTGSTNGAFAQATFNNPAGIKHDGSRLFVSEFGNHIVRVLE